MCQKATQFLESKDNPYINLDALLKDFHEFGAEHPNRLHQDYGQEIVQELLTNQYLAEIPSPLGKLLLLGPKGRCSLGLAPFYKSPPESAASQVIRRRVKESLEQQGWIYQTKLNQNLLVFQDLEAKTVYVAARYHDYSARSVRRILATMKPRFIHESSCLLVLTKLPDRLTILRRNSQPFLHLQHLPTFKGEEFNA